MHSETQSLQPQHELVAQGLQKNPGSVQPPLAVHGGAQECVSQTHSLPPVHGEFASQFSGWTGTHAALQSSHVGQLEVAHALHSELGSHAFPQKSVASQAFAHRPTPNRQTPPGHSSCEWHDFDPLPVDAPFDVLAELVLPPPVPSTIWTSAAHPTSRAAARSERRGARIRGA